MRTEFEADRTASDDSNTIVVAESTNPATNNHGNPIDDADVKPLALSGVTLPASAMKSADLLSS